MSDEPRCQRCGALVSADAEWCGQCYSPLQPTGTVRSPADVVSGKLEMESGNLTWTCPVCGERNPIEAAGCGVCGTPFARLFEEPEMGPSIEPQAAAIWSLVLPGLGHWKAGRRPDGVARMVLFGWTFGALLVLLVARLGKGGLGSTFPLFVLFLTSAGAVYVLSAVDAHRLAGGEEPLIGSRVLLWSSVALVVLTVLVASLVTLPAARR